ncbi:hypothetical protein F5Y16DRAFT_166112 [Xylariaceae sp. FL0255]|nr:hypothetical protein F5Y16DRAFT_166112 [Xylariaceae sp. FL0255]
MATYQYYDAGMPIPQSKDGDVAYSSYAYGYNNSYSVSPPETSDPSVSSGAGTYSYGGSSSSAAHMKSGTSSSYHHSGHHGGHHHSSHHGHHHGHHGSVGGGAPGDDCYYYSSDSAGSASGVDFNEYMQDRFADSFDPLEMDRSVARQAQASGTLNAKHRELLELQAKAQARLAKSRARFADGLRDAQEVRSNLEWTSKKVSSLKKKAEKKHSKEYQKARERYPSPEY